MVLRTSSSGSRSNLRWNAWNLLLLIPLLWLITPIYNKTGPTLIGMPFFYWFLLAGIPVAAICTSIVFMKTKDEPVVTDLPDQLNVDDLDEGWPSPSLRGDGCEHFALDRADHLHCAVRRGVGDGFVASRWRAGQTLNHLDEWGLGGRKFGSWISWFLIGGDLYTAYTFVAVPALLFSAGAAGFFALPYTLVTYPIVFLPLLRLWSVSRVHGSVTPADFVRGRFGSPALALIVAITGIVATMPTSRCSWSGWRRCCARWASTAPGSSGTFRCSSRSSSWPSTPTSPACGLRR